MLCTMPAMPRQKPEADKRSETVSARVSESEFAELQRIAEDDDRTVSYVAAKAIREFLERERKKRKG
jgi:predicted transcriptional regulator